MAGRREPPPSPPTAATLAVGGLVAARMPEPLVVLLVTHEWGRPEPRPDLHDGLEVGVVLSGEQERHWQDRVTTLGPGDIWLVNTLEPHAWRFTRPGLVVVLEFAPAFLGPALPGEMPWLAPFSVPPAQRPEVIGAAMRRDTLAIAEEFRQEIEARGRGWVSAVKINLMRLLLLLTREWKPPEGRIGAGQGLSHEVQRVMPALDALRARPEARLALAEVAAACGLSATQFNRVFRAAMGTSFREFALRSRVSAAARQLLETDLTTEGIAERTGFTDHSHLHRMFVRYYQCTPRQYRLLRGITPRLGASPYPVEGQEAPAGQGATVR
jgi:AraC-like DNA-binding protein